MRQGNAKVIDQEDRAGKSWWEEESLALLNHDLRNALASIASALQILRMQGYVNPLAEQAGRTIERQAEQLAHLADHLSDVAGIPRAEPPARRAPAEPRRTESRPRRILVVDDNHDAADSTGTLLLLWEHQVRVAYDGKSALTLAREFKPEVCLLDIGMPGMDGFQVARQFRDDPVLRDTMLVAMTGFDQEGDRKLSVDAGFQAYLVKPVEVGALQDFLARAPSAKAAPGNL
jgi:CheY-like chemotaxis protein